MSITILDSETFYYDSQDSHQGRHTVLRTLMPGYCWFDPGQYLWTVQDDTDYLWRADEDGLKWIEWAQLNPNRIAARWDEIQREELLAIEMGHEEFFVGDVATLSLGSEIEIRPLAVDHGVGLDVWIVELTIPSGTDICRFNVYGKENLEWFRKRAILDKLMIVALRGFKFQEVVI